ncbi:F-box protein At4g35930 [Vitis vinifera]|nr:F-box protein At4g35930 [Vitis vinifera]
MGKVSPKERGMKTPKQKRRQRNSSNKYLRPGALAQLRYSKAATKSCTDLVKKQVAVLDSKKADSDIALGGEAIDESLPIASPEKFGFSPVIGQLKQSSLMGTPRTPRVDECESESKLESLPMDLLVKILCHLHHDQLRAVFHVSQRIRKAVLLARQFHFNYTTPDRSRQEMLRTMTPLPTEHWPFVSKGDGKGVFLASPHTPKAPRHGPRPPSRLKVTEMRQIAAVLFQESALPSRCMVPSILPKPLCKSLASNRVLFYEDELCQAVAQNKLL